MLSSTETLIKALRVLAEDIKSDDGVANAAIAEAAERLIELQNKNIELGEELAVANNWVEYHQNHVDDLIKENVEIKNALRSWLKLTDLAIQDVVPEWLSPIIRNNIKDSNTILNRYEKEENSPTTTHS